MKQINKIIAIVILLYATACSHNDTEYTKPTKVAEFVGQKLLDDVEKSTEIYTETMDELMDFYSDSIPEDVTYEELLEYGNTLFQSKLYSNVIDLQEIQ